MSRPRLYQLLVHANHALTRRVEEVVRSELGVTAAQLGALLTLDRRDGCTLSTLARELSVHKSAITKLAENLERGGLIERRACSDDGRASRVWLTERAHDVIRRGRPIERRWSARMTEGFSDAEIALIARFLSAVAERSADSEEADTWRTRAKKPIARRASSARRTVD